MSDYIIAEGYIAVDENGPPGGAAIDIRGANELIIILDDDANNMNSNYGDIASFTSTFHATNKFPMKAGETHTETADLFKYWFPICNTGESANVRYKALNSRKGV